MFFFFFYRGVGSQVNDKDSQPPFKTHQQACGMRSAFVKGWGPQRNSEHSGPRGTVYKYIFIFKRPRPGAVLCSEAEATLTSGAACHSGKS